MLADGDRGSFLIPSCRYAPGKREHPSPAEFGHGIGPFAKHLPDSVKHVSSKPSSVAMHKNVAVVSCPHRES